jgi:hypothetical protein
MIALPQLTARAARAASAPSSDAATGADAGTDPDDAHTQFQERALAAQRSSFDEAMEENAEIEREREALEQLLLAQVKYEDSVLAKWIAMI